MKKILSDIASAASLLFERGLVDGSAGNISMLVPSSGEEESGAEMKFRTPLPALNGKEIIITASGSRMYDVRREPEAYSVRCTVSGDSSSVKFSGGMKPSSELLMHAYIYSSILSAGRSAACIIHAHPPFLNALTGIAGNDEEKINLYMKSAHFEFSCMFPEGIGSVGCIEPGTEELASSCMLAFSRFNAVLLQRHGAVACGEDFKSAFDRIDSAEAVAKVFLLSGLKAPTL